MLQQHFSPEKVSGYLKKQMHLFPEQYVCRETIYNAIYALPVGELRKELIHCLRHGRSSRRTRRGSVDRWGRSFYSDPGRAECHRVCIKYKTKKMVQF